MSGEGASTNPAPAEVGDIGELTDTGGATAEHNKVTASYTIFLIVVAIVFLAIAIVFGVNTYFYSKIKEKGCSTSISASEANALYWTNMILAIISAIMFFVSIVLIFTETKAPEYANKYLGYLRHTGYRDPETNEFTSYGDVAARKAREYAGRARGYVGSRAATLRAGLGGAAEGVGGRLTAAGTELGRVPAAARIGYQVGAARV